MDVVTALGNTVNLNEEENKIFLIVKESVEYLLENKGVDWTKTVFERIGQLGLQKNYQVLSTIHNKEWLFDMVWCTRKDASLKSVELILESELSHRSNTQYGLAGLVSDFEKLLVGNAELRVMICCNEGNSDYPANIHRVIDVFEKSMASFITESSIRVLLIVIDDYTSGDVVPHILTSRSIFQLA